MKFSTKWPSIGCLDVHMIKTLLSAQLDDFDRCIEILTWSKNSKTKEMTLRLKDE